MQTLLGQLAGIVALFAYGVYILDALRGKTKPNRATWFVWTVLGFILMASYYYSGATTTIWVPMSTGVGCLLIFLVSLKKGEGGWTRFDKACLVGAGIGLLLWWIFNSPVTALFLNTFIDFIGALPTLKKSFYEPKGESRLAWGLFLIGNTLNLFALQTLDFAIVLIPLWFFLFSTTMTILLARRRRN